MYKIAALDLDGTLLTSEHKAPSFTQKTLTTLHQHGKEFVFATGRHHIDIIGKNLRLCAPLRHRKLSQ